MNKVNLKDNIWIEEFCEEEIKNATLDTWCKEDDLIWHGKTSKIPEEILEKCVCKIVSNNPPDKEIKFRGKYVNYSDYTKYCDSLKESIQSACKQIYCIIYKTN